MNCPSLTTPCPVDWRRAPARPTDGELHLWTWSADGPLTAAEHLELLDAEQRERHTRLVTTELQQRFLAAHVGLRRVLAGYLGATPQQLEFGRAEFGKPFVQGATLPFNLSHSGNQVLLAVAAAEVGVDVEQARPVTDLDALAKKYFAPAERTEYDSLTAGARREAFFRLWSRKEAILKLTGLGLQASAQELQVGCDLPSAQRQVPLPPHWPTPLESAWLADLDIPVPFVAAVACADAVRNVRVYTVA